MKDANLSNGGKVAATEYDVRVHGKDISCDCGARVICVTPNNDEREPFFKTTGNGDSRHRDGCSEIRNLYINHIEQGFRYVDSIKSVPDAELVVISFEVGKKTGFSGASTGITENERKLKPNYINKPDHITKKIHDSVKTLKKLADLIRKNEPEQLGKIIFKMYGEKIHFYDFVINQNKAYQRAKFDECNQEYIVYGKIGKVVKKDKVMFINFDEQEGASPFALVVFANKFAQFEFAEKLEGKFVLAFGNVGLKKGNDGAQMILNDHRFLCELPK